MESEGALELLHRLRRWSFVYVGVPAVLVAIAVAWAVSSVVLGSFARMVAEGVNGFIDESYSNPASLAPGSASGDRLAEIIRLRMRQDNLVAVRLVDPRGVTLYSSDGRESGRLVPLDGEDEAALAGDVQSTLVTGDPLMGSFGGPVLRVVAPVAPSWASAPVGVVEIYKPLGPLANALAGSVTAVVATVLIGATTTLALLWFVLGHAIRDIERSRDDIGELNAHLATSLDELERHSLGTLQALIAAVDAKDRYTARHSLYVTAYACEIAARLGTPEDVKLLEKAGLLHDIGKIAIPESVLLKPAGQDPEERARMAEHARAGAVLIEQVPFLVPVRDIVLHHHENWDGSGYPDGLRGEGIPWLARILAVADSFDAMTSDRPYRAAMHLSAARAELQAGAGTQFDPAIVREFLRAIDEGGIKPPSPVTDLSAGKAERLAS